MAILAVHLPQPHIGRISHDTEMLGQFKNNMLIELQWILPKEMESYRHSLAESLIDFSVAEIKGGKIVGFAASLSSLGKDAKSLEILNFIRFAVWKWFGVKLLETDGGSVSYSLSQCYPYVTHLQMEY